MFPRRVWILHERFATTRERVDTFFGAITVYTEERNPLKRVIFAPLLSFCYSYSIRATINHTSKMCFRRHNFMTSGEFIIHRDKRFRGNERSLFRDLDRNWRSIDNSRVITQKRHKTAAIRYIGRLYRIRTRIFDNITSSGIHEGKENPLKRLESYLRGRFKLTESLIPFERSRNRLPRRQPRW